MNSQVHSLVENAKISTLRLMISTGIINVRHYEFLLIGIINNNIKFVKELLKHGANPNLGMSMCLDTNNIAALKLLLAHGATTLAIIPTDVVYLLIRKRYKMLDELIAAGYDLNDVTPFMADGLKKNIRIKRFFSVHGIVL